MARGRDPVVAVVGPTATGKTAVAVGLALRLGAAELVSADSRQILRGLRVGTNRPLPEELRGVPCHLLDLADPGEPFSVADWVVEARRCLAGLDRRGVRPIVVGGTGLYLRALLDEFELPGGQPDPARRADLSERAGTPKGLSELARELGRRDPQGAAHIDLRNPRRVVRAIEILDADGSLAAHRHRGPGRATTWIGLDATPELQRRTVDDRSSAMISSGLVEETAAALERGVPALVLERSGIGYREALGVMAGTLTEADAVDAIAGRTRRYVKAQRTWFRRDARITWLHRERTDDLPQIIEAAAALIGA
jgi:tRNA dimethylallyltransferase